MMMGEFRYELSALTHLRLHDDGHVPVNRVTSQVHTRNVFELLSWIRECPKLLLNLTMKAVEDGVDSRA